MGTHRALNSDSVLLSNSIMPTVLRVGPYRFHFYSREPGEPPHIHVARDDNEAKFWLQPLALARNYGFPTHEINELAQIVRQHLDVLNQKWSDYHGTKS